MSKNRATISSGNGEKFCLNKEAFMSTLKRKLKELFKENLRLRQDHLKFRLKWKEENGKSEMLRMLFMKQADSLKPRRWSSVRHINKWTDQGRRQKRWPFGELDEEFAVWNRIELDIFGFVCDLRRKRRGSTIEN